MRTPATRWRDLWDALRIEGEMNAGISETLRVLWDRWVEVDMLVLGLKIIYPPKQAVVESIGHHRGNSVKSSVIKSAVVSILSSLGLT
jgi:hypothetical protein